MNGESPIADLAMLKVHASKAMELCAREAMQILVEQDIFELIAGLEKLREFIER